MRQPISKTTLPLIVGVVALLVAMFAPASALAQDDQNLITATGVAGVEVGSTIDELAESLNDFDVSDDVRLTVDLRGHTVSQNGRVAFRAAQVVPESPQIELFIISGDTYRTAEDVGPGTAIADAVEQYGTATFMLDRNNSGREFVVFADQPDGPIAFRTYGIAGAYVGDYAGAATTTTSYQGDAEIASVWIGCTSVKACIRSGASVVGESSDAAETAAAEAEAKQAERVAAAAEAERLAAEEAEEAEEAELLAAEQAAAAEAEQAASEDAADRSPASSTESSQSDDVLAKTGLAQTRPIAIVSVLVLFGIGLVLLERRFGLGPEWLR